MGCMSSKTAADPAEKDAQQRNVKIEKILKSDRKTMDRTIRILLLGTCSPDRNDIFVLIIMTRRGRIGKIYNHQTDAHYSFGWFSRR